MAESKNKRKDKRKKIRKAISAQCVEGQDDDLIEWYLSIESGSRQKEVKRILRLGLGLPMRQETVYEKLSSDDIKDLIERRFDEMWAATQREIQAAINSMDYAPPGASIYESVGSKKVDAETLRQRQENIAKDEW